MLQMQMLRGMCTVSSV